MDVTDTELAVVHVIAEGSRRDVSWYNINFSDVPIGFVKGVSITYPPTIGTILGVKKWLKSALHYLFTLIITLHLKGFCWNPSG
jgi:hypothetical protein